MPFKEGQLSLTGFLAEIPLKHTLKKRLIGEPYLRLWDYFTTLSFLYESGAILGRTKRDKISTLVNMLAVPGAETNKLIQMFQQDAEERLDKFRREVGKEPATFNEFIFFREFEDSLVAAFGLTLSGLVEEYMRGNKEVVKVFDHKVSLKDAWPVIQAYGADGIGFGSSFPELTERMYKNAYENVDMDKWAEARKMGVDIPEKPDIVSLEEREKAVLQMVAAYTSEYYPELIDPLGLRVYLERAEGDK